MVLWPLNDVYLLECSLGFMDTFLKIEHGRSDRLSFPILGYKKKDCGFCLRCLLPLSFELHAFGRKQLHVIRQPNGDTLMSKFRRRIFWDLLMEERVRLESEPFLLKLWRDYSTSQYLLWALLSDPEPEPSKKTAPRFLTHWNYEIIKMLLSASKFEIICI